MPNSNIYQKVLLRLTHWFGYKTIWKDKVKTRSKWRLYYMMFVRLLLHQKSL